MLKKFPSGDVIVRQYPSGNVMFRHLPVAQAEADQLQDFMGKGLFLFVTMPVIRLLGDAPKSQFFQTNFMCTDG